MLQIFAQQLPFACFELYDTVSAASFDEVGNEDSDVDNGRCHGSEGCALDAPAEEGYEDDVEEDVK